MVKLNVTPSQLAAALNYAGFNQAGALVVLNGTGQVTEFANYSPAGEFVLFVLTSAIPPSALEAAGIPIVSQWQVQGISG